MDAGLVREALETAPHHASREVDRRRPVPRRELDAHGGAARQVLADAQAASARGEIDEGGRMPSRADAITRAEEAGAPRRAAAVDSAVFGFWRLFHGERRSIGQAHD